MNENNSLENNPQTTAETTENAVVQAELQSGEKVFTFVMFVFCAVMFYQSYLLWNKNPGLSGPATFPMITSGFPMLLLFFSIIGNFRKKTPVSGVASLGEKTKIVIEYLFSRNVTIALIFIVSYCLLLSYGVPFYVTTSLFLWGLMTLLYKGNYVKNVIWTAMCIAFIFVVFGLGFGVIMP